MPSSLVLLAKRSLVRVLISLATVYHIGLNITRDSSDIDVTRAYRRVVLKAHPDKGGTVAHAQQLQEAKEAWDKAKEDAQANQRRGSRPSAPSSGAPPAADDDDDETVLCDPRAEKKIFRVHGTAVLLTYHGIKDLAHWRRFVQHVRDNLKHWRVKHWCGTLEITKKGKLHVHLMLEFRSEVDWASSRFAFEALAPRADVCDLLGEGFCKRKMRQSIDRAMFYCFADKLGTQRDEEGKECTVGNYMPAWVVDAPFTYPVLGKWPENLWKAYKLSTDTYENKYLYNCRDGVVYRFRNVEAVRQRQEAKEEEEEMAEVSKRIRTTCFDRPFPEVPEARAWLELFTQEKDRYPFLLVVGPSHTGKTEWAKSLFKAHHEVKVGPLTHFPDTMRHFSRKVHDGIVVDDIRDFRFLVEQQDKLQGKYDNRVEFASTPGGQCAYRLWLWKVPVVVTANLSTKNHDLLESDDFLGNPLNRVVVRFPPSASSS